MIPGYVFYACERGPECGFITWDVPTKDFCPACGKTMFKRSGRGALKPFCINEVCPNFVPEDERGYKRKAAAKSGEEPAGEAAEEEKKPAAKKAAAKKSAAKKTTAKKTTAKKTAAKAKDKE